MLEEIQNVPLRQTYDTEYYLEGLAETSKVSKCIPENYDYLSSVFIRKYVLVAMHEQRIHI